MSQLYMFFFLYIPLQEKHWDDLFSMVLSGKPQLEELSEAECDVECEVGVWGGWAFSAFSP